MQRLQHQRILQHLEAPIASSGSNASASELTGSVLAVRRHHEGELEKRVALLRSDGTLTRLLENSSATCTSDELLSSADDLSHAEVSGFSWMPSIENFIGRNAKARKSYNEVLRDDANFHNFRSVELMAAHYRASAPAASLFPRFEFAESDTFSGVRRAQNIAWSQHSVRRGIAYAKDGNYSFAMKCYEDAIEVCDTNADAFVAMGAAYANHDQLESALKHLTKALEIDPAHPNAQKYLEATKHKLSERESAARSANKPAGKAWPRRSVGGPGGSPKPTAGADEYEWLKSVLGKKEGGKQKKKREEKKRKKRDKKEKRTKDEGIKKRKRDKRPKERKRAGSASPSKSDGSSSRVSAATAESKATRPVDEEDGRDGSSSSSKSDEAMARYSLQSSDLPLRRSVMIQDDGDESIRISITQ